MNCNTNEEKKSTSTDRSIKTSAVQVIKQKKCLPETGCIQEGGETNKSILVLLLYKSEVRHQLK